MSIKTPFLFFLAIAISACGSAFIPDENAASQPADEPAAVTLFQFEEPKVVGEFENWLNFAPGDIDGDGNLDLVAAEQDGTLRWLESDGKGGFEEQNTAWGAHAISNLLDDMGAIACHGLPVGILAQRPGVDVADLDGDGVDEIMVWLQVEVTNFDMLYSVTAIIDVEDETTITAKPVFISTTADSRANIIADLDGDGGSEILIHDTYGFYLHRSGAEAVVELATSVWGDGNARAWAYDINNDGKLDIVSAIYGSQLNAMVGFIAHETVGFYEAFVEETDYYAVSHGNGNARKPATDIAVNTTDGWLKWLRPEGLTPVFEWGELSPHTVINGDFNGDGHMDIITRVSDEPETLVGLNGDGTGQFSEVETVFAVAYAEQVFDIDGDGLDDLFRMQYLGEADYTLEILLNAGAN
jgi:hypothetical protein